MSELTPQQLQDYFYDRCTADEEFAIQNWFADRSNAAKADTLLAELFDSINVDDRQMARNAFASFCRKIGYRYNGRGRARRYGPRGFLIIQRIAAVLAIPLLCATIYLYKADTRQEWKEVSVPYGQSGRVVLSDGTTLWLNAGSRVTYPDAFRGKKRRVFAEGEIFADVAGDPRRPFIVAFSDVDVEVLGTKFNMRSYANDQTVELALVEGEVRFVANTANAEQKVRMKQGEVVQFNRATGHVDMQTFNPENFRSFYANGEMHFFNQPFGDIMAMLERCFNVKIVILDEKLSKEQYFAFFTSYDSLDQILKTINVDNNMKIEKRDGIIFISGNR